MLTSKLSLKARLTLLAVSCFFFLLIVGRLYRVTDYPLKIIHQTVGDDDDKSDGLKPSEESPTIHQEPTALTSHDDPNAVPHPIDHLIRDADKKWAALLNKQVYNLTQVAEQYRLRRGRHPPPGFDKWYEYAKSKKLFFIEDLFDQIYDDVSPYWGLDPKEMRRQASGFDPRIVIRNHTVASVGRTGVNWLEVWMDMVSKFENFLPDMDIPLNGMDESRIIIPWDKLSEYREQDLIRRKAIDPSTATDKYMQLDAFDPEALPESWGPAWEGPGRPFWDIMRDACPPESPGRTSNIPHLDFANPPPEFFNYRNFSKTGYVEDFEKSKDPCWRAELQGMHGSFIEPISLSTAHELFPLFGGSKLTVNNEILLPPPMYYFDNPMYSGGFKNTGGSWSKKKDTIFWRGIASGGRIREDTWTVYQRQRFLSMLNGTTVATTNGSSSAGINFRQPDYQYYNVWAGIDGKLPEFLDEHTDLGFLDLKCFPPEDGFHCVYQDPYFSIVEPVPMKDQYAYKYLPDIDGNSFSGRYRAFLLSTSLPIKATVYKEWHDSRLIPWAHFVPLDSLYMDIYGILQYFVGYKGHNGHDRQAEKIAMGGKRWAEQVLRLEDMEIYVFRLLLEYARLMDDNRDTLAFVNDLQA